MASPVGFCNRVSISRPNGLRCICFTARSSKITNYSLCPRTHSFTVCMVPLQTAMFTQCPLRSRHMKPVPGLKLQPDREVKLPFGASFLLAERLLCSLSWWPSGHDPSFLPLKNKCCRSFPIITCPRVYPSPSTTGTSSKITINR